MNKSLLLVLTLLALGGCKELSPYLETAQTIANQAGQPSRQESTQAVRLSLNNGIDKAVTSLSKAGGFSSSQYRVPLPPKLTDLASKARQYGLGHYVDEFEGSMNKAAEQAVPRALGIFKASIRNLSLSDVIGLLRGGDNAITDYFKRSAGPALTQAFLPEVRQVTGQVGVTKDYKALTDRVAQYGSLVGWEAPQSIDLDQYITEHAVDSLFAEVAKMEQNIRQDPMQQASALLRKVFSYYQ